MAKRRRQATRHGYVVIDKPAGWTSHDVVARVRRLVNERRVGHAGTLDPAATGVLPVAVGLATRTVEYLADASKAYRAWIRFGVTTDSADADGAITGEVDASHLTLETLRPILETFRGQIRQRPPMHSAISVGGTRLYDLARRGVEIDVPEREVTIHALNIVSWESPVLCLDVECSKGTYIRALARDIGELAGTGAHLARLVRTRSGPFTLDDAMSLDQLESELATAGGWERISRAPDAVLDGLPRLDLDRDQAIDWGHGKPVPFAEADVPDGAPVRAYDREERWLGIGTIDRKHGVVRPAKVIATEQGRHVSKAVYRSFRDVPAGQHIVSIGTFDGVHLGHRYLLQQAAARAADLGLPLLVATFEPNPAQVIRPDTFPGRISTPEDKLARLFAASAGEVLVIPFTEDLMRATPEEFLAQLVDAAHPREVWVGEGFALGYKRSGDIARLTAIGEDMGFALHAVPRRELGGDIVSSSRIRQHLLEGAPDAAARLLGAPYRLSGEVIHGAQVGRTIGFPTANVEPPAQMAQLPDGIYATRASIGDDIRQHQAMTYIGTRPALNTGARQIETHILDFDGDLYGKVLHTDFVERLRPDADFPSVDALIAQLKRDEEQARDVLASPGALGETVPEAASGH